MDENKLLETRVKNGYDPDLTAGIELDYEDKSYSCSHVKDSHIPRILWIVTDGGNGGDYVCLDCLLEWVAAHKQDIGL